MSEHVCCSLDGTGIDPNLLSKRFRKLRVAMVASGEALPPVTFHDLRHTFASNLIASGVNLKVVAEALRHADVRLVGDTYGHLRPTAVAEATEQLSLLVEGSPPTG